jgi:tRNA(fMet)-specific endonuclease VapC
MYLLDTDHIALLDRGGAEGQRIRARLSQMPGAEVTASVVSYEEQLRGWMAYLAQLRVVARQVDGYRRLERMLEFYCGTPLLAFDERAAERFHELWLTRIRVGTMDLKIAAIALANDPRSCPATRKTSVGSLVCTVRIGLPERAPTLAWAVKARFRPRR